MRLVRRLGCGQAAEPSCPDRRYRREGSEGSSYAVLAPCDYVDVFMTHDIETAAGFRHSSEPLARATEIWTAKEQDQSKKIARALPGPT